MFQNQAACIDLILPNMPKSFQNTGVIGTGAVTATCSFSHF